MWSRRPWGFRGPSGEEHESQELRSGVLEAPVTGIPTVLDESAVPINGDSHQKIVILGAIHQKTVIFGVVHQKTMTSRSARPSPEEDCSIDAFV